ncbi:5,10-methylenetetrahydrofolate reductase-like isoform X3 [Drosophila kikkawai]|uniref:5,10-methylenetetrahydrofolate reductase-like isoform X3 n=1 Tax=Drosophila kikkawai TaxID=30033 RepID=A0ABM4GEW6_DROKI
MAHFVDSPRQNFFSYVPCVTFASKQHGVKEPRIGPLIEGRQLQQRLYYGIEVMPHTDGIPVCLNLNRLLPFMPLFVSIAWLAKSSWDVEPLGRVDSLQLAKHLASKIPVMPHLTLYRLNDERLDQFLDLNFSNVLALRGSTIYENQTYAYSKTIVERAKEKFKDKATVCVAGFPEGYNIAEGEPPDLKIHLHYLKEKVDAGADCIITQACYRPEIIIDYVKKVRAAGITVPIMVGIAAHESFKKYKTIEKEQGARLPPRLHEKLAKMGNKFEKDVRTDPHLIRNLFVRINVNIICQILKADIQVYGFQIFTLNNFGATAGLLRELRQQKLFGDRNKGRPRQCLDNYSQIYLAFNNDTQKLSFYVTAQW